MTETPSGPYDREQDDTSIFPQGGRPPYAAPEWRRDDGAGTGPQGARYGSAPVAGTDGLTPGRGAQAPAGPERAAQYPMGAAPAGPDFQDRSVPAGPDLRNRTNPTGPVQGGYGASRYPYAGGPVPPASGAPWPYAAPEPAKRGGKRLIAVAAVTAVLGGLVGGGTVALLDPGSPTAVTAGGISVDGSSAPAVATRAGTVEAAAVTAMKSVVTLAVKGSQESGSGSGVVIRSDGYILTNEHVTAVADGGGSITVQLADGRQATATLVGADKATDLAVVKVNLTGLTAATFADSDAVKVGQTVVAVGSPLGLDGTVTEGIVSALHRPTTGGSDNSAVIDALQTDAAINPGNSGGALVDLAGRVVGINQSIATSGSGSQYGQGTSSGNIGIGFAIPSGTAARIAGELIADGTATHAYLGVQTRSATDRTSGTTTGATISTVESGGPAAAAGLKAGDVVVKVGDRVIGESGELVAAVRSYAPNSTVTVTVRRGTATQAISVTLGSDAKQ